jgi:hypothetical protein
MPRVTQAMKTNQRQIEIEKGGGVMVPGGRTWFYVYPMSNQKNPSEVWGIFFPSTGMDLRLTKSQAEVMVEFFKQNKLAE